MGKNRITNDFVALKQIVDNGAERGLVGFPLTALREMKILKALHHDNILALKETITSKGEYTISWP